MIIVIVVVVILLIAVVAIELLPSPSVRVAGIYVWAPDDVCGLQSNPINDGGYPVPYGGYNANISETDLWTFDVPNINATACTIHSVTTNTSGFSLSAIQVPLTIPGGDLNASLNITITTPSSSFSGNLNLVFA